MDVTEFGMTIEPVRPLQPEKASKLIDVNELGKDNEPVSPQQPSNA